MLISVGKDQQFVSKLSNMHLNKIVYSCFILDEYVLSKLINSFPSLFSFFMFKTLFCKYS